MFARLDHRRLLRYAGLFTWGAVGVPLLVLSQPVDPAVDLSQAGLEGFVSIWRAWLAWILFGASYAWLTQSLGTRRVGIFDYLVLVLLIVSAVGVGYYSNSGLGSILLMVVACVLPWLLPVAVGIAWLILSQLVVMPLFRGIGFSWTEAVLQSILYAGFCVFIFVTSLVARQQSLAREEQRRLNSELRATRALLAESARVNERTRISRELHDLLGHHLTALSLNLEVASHLTEGQAHEHIDQAHTLARLLLSDVREAVSQIRDNDAIDMAATLLPLADNVPGLSIDMAMPRPFLIDDPERAHVLLRCTQEIITNAVRHAQARILRLRYSWDGHAIRLHARDDGRGAEDAVAGNGLRGIRERLAEYGGELETETSAGQGFVLRLRLPLEPGTPVPAEPPAPEPAVAPNPVGAAS
ncbi:sensor histidine kinase [Luteimonas aquatica]|uniref:sensor histidine kinase n=1 Tax=Luteimonas aquatica TaxID=450364 RepID=UPI001F5AEBE4|nr:histidine kinase [Luteimonas aquatica]